MWCHARDKLWHTELVPIRYNKNSELTVKVSPDKTHFDFPLMSK